MSLQPARCDDGTKFTLDHTPEDPSDDPPVLTLPDAPDFGETLHASAEIEAEPVEWTLTLTSVSPHLADPSGKLDPDAVEDIAIIVHYKVA